MGQDQKPDHTPRLPEPQSKIDRRQDRRHIVMLRQVPLEQDRQYRLDAYISEISVYGCRFYCKGNLQAGDVIALCLDKVQMTVATVTWCRGDVAGCRFAIPIGMDVIAQMAFNIA